MKIMLLRVQVHQLNSTECFKFDLHMSNIQLNPFPYVLLLESSRGK